MDGMKEVVKRARLLLPAILALLCLAGIASADITTQPLQFCQGLISSNAPMPDVVTYASLIMLAMTVVIAICYLIGNSLNFDKLKKFSISEFSELIATLIILMVFIWGSLSLAPSNVVLPAGGSYQYYGAYLGDCQNLYTSFLNTLPIFAGMFAGQTIINIFSKLSFSLTVADLGVSGVTPLGGGTFLSFYLLARIITVAFVFSNLNLLVVSVLAIVSNVFPVFLYAGIILRTFPWSRAAGGAFLGLYLGFYLAFPLLLTAMLPTVQCVSACSLPSTTISPSSTVPSISGASQGDFLSSISSLLSSLMDVFFQNWPALAMQILEPSIANFVAFVIAFYISYNIMEAAGDLLGAPSLTSAHTFRNLL